MPWTAGLSDTMATPIANEVAFLKWFCTLLDQHDLDGDVFGEYAVALFSAR